MEKVYPKTWQNLILSMNQLPFVVNAVQRGYLKDESSTRSVHDFFEMIYMKRGSGVFEISQRKVSVGPNDLVMIKPGQMHGFTANNKDNCELIVLYFTFSDKFGEMISAIPVNEFLAFVSHSEESPYISIKVSQKNEIINVMNRLIAEKKDAELDCGYMQQLLMMELFVLVSRVLRMEWQNSIKNGSAKVKELVQISVSYINNNFERDLDLAAIAGHVFLSPSYFIRVFREETGMSPINYLLKVRIDNAMEMLSTTNTKVRDIAGSVGFSNQQRFNEMFRKFTGMTPLEYRRQSK